MWTKIKPEWLLIDYLPQLTRKPDQTQYKDVIIGSNIAQNDSYRPQEVIYCHCLPHFTYKVDQKWN